MKHLFDIAYPVNEEAYRTALLELKASKKKTIHYSFDYAIARWLCEIAPDDVEIDWDAFENEVKLQTLLPLVTGSSEELGLDDENTSTRAWIDTVRGGRSGLVWLIEALKSLAVTERVKAHLYEAVEIPIEWTPRRETFVAENSPIHFHPEPLERGPVDLRRYIVKPVKITKADPREIVHLAKMELTLREREMYPISHANVQDVTLYTLEKGLQIACIGILPERRMHLEGLWGFLFLKNGLPIGYGCFSALFGSAEIAANIFDEFRQGESARTYASLLRVIHHHTEATSFTVMRYQFGYINPEAIKSGAFWFYHKLGFRPLDPDHALLVESEYKRIKTEKGYRSPGKVLRQLAKKNLYLSLTESRNVLGHLEYQKISHAVTRMIGQEFEGCREAAIRAARKRIKLRLPANSVGDEFALNYALFDFERWSEKDKRGLIEIVRAKADPKQERDFVLKMNRHQKLKEMIWAYIR